MSLTRRTFVKSASAALAATKLPRAHALSPAPAAAPLRQLDYAQVQLLPGRMREQFDRNHAFFLALDNDALLKPFRQLTGQPAPGADMGGWYSPSPLFDPPRNMTGYVPGHTFGQYVSGLARAYAITGDKATQAKVHALVRGFAGTVSPKFYEGYCLPCYTFDKSMCGLIDAHQFAQDPIALDVLRHATDAVLPFLPDHALTRAEMRARPHPNEAFTWDEPYTLPENFYLAYKRSGDTRYRDLARRFLQDKTYFTPLSQNQNILNGEHAYSHVNALSSAMQAYLTDGSQMHFDAARNGFQMVADQSYATGGWGPNETLRAPGSNDLADSLTSTHASFETPCGAYGHFKITRYLLTTTGNPMYGDSMERVLYNTILGALPIEPDGSSFYYADYNNDGHKFRHEDKWPCCSGTFPQITADYGISSYFATPRGLAVNLYTPSRVSWKQGSAIVSLTQQTEFPLSNKTTLVLQTDRKTPFRLDLRIPEWAGSDQTRIAVNGKPLAASTKQQSWFSIDRTWSNNDRIEIAFNLKPHLLPLDAGHKNVVALAYGPLVLFGIQPVPVKFSANELLGVQRTSARSSEFFVNTAGGRIVFKPYMDIRSEHYRLYQQI